MKPNLDQGPDYERGFVDGMLYQTQTSVDKAVNAMAQPEQEPAKLWCETCEGTGQVYQEHQAGCHVGGHFKCPDCDGEGHIVSRLYSTTPPKRPWAGLTVVEIMREWHSANDSVVDFARVIEAKLKEKNT